MNGRSLAMKADRALELAVFYLSALLMVALTSTIFYAVFMRYVFNSSPSWSEEVPRIIFLWMTYLAIGVAIKRGQNLRVMVIIERFPPHVRLVLEMLMHAAVFVMLGFLLWNNAPVLALSSGTRMLGTGWPDAVRYWPLSVGSVVMAFYQVRQVLRSVEDYRNAAGLESA